VVAKEAFVQRFASVRFDGVLAASERDEATRALVSAGATVTSWNACGARTYATAALGSDVATATLSALIGADVVSPPLLVLRVVPDAARALAGLEAALGGAGRPAGIRDARRVAAAVVVECDAARTPLATLVALIDTELAFAPGRTLEPLVGIDDATLVAFAGAALAEPDLDENCLIETHLAAFLATAER